MNVIIITGRLTRDPEIKAAANTTIANFSMAVDRRFKREGEPTADFFNLTAFGKTAELIEKYVTKGTKLGIAGHLQNDTYTNKDGQKVTATKIMVDALEFMESSHSAKGNESEAEPSLSDGFKSAVDDSELPFD